jgi:SWI/SNF-related matrix-associated actin-dependent regulator 1 of chromatin subfamily A
VVIDKAQFSLRELGLFSISMQISLERDFVTDKRDGSAITYPEAIIARHGDPTQLKTGGWRFHKNDREAFWWTPDDFRAAPMYESADTPELRDRLWGMLHSYISSTAQDSTARLLAPEGLSYMPYQRAGIAYALSKNSCLIADEPGLGKTIQAIGVMNNDPYCKRAIVVSPASLKINWKREIQKWSIRPVAVYIASGRKPNEADVYHFFKKYPADALKVIIINYDILNGWAPFLKKSSSATLVFDEAHLLKNATSKRSKAAFSLPASRRLFLSGTPILSRPKEIFPLLHSIDPITFNNFFRFGMRYCNGRQGYSGWDFNGSSNLEELNVLLRCKLMIRRKKDDVLKDLPPKIRQVVILSNPNPQEEIAVKKMLAEAGAFLNEDSPEPKVGSIGVAELALKRHDDALLKVPQVVDYVKNMLEGGVDKLILFAYHDDVLNAYQHYFKEISVRVSGGISMARRQEAVDNFQNNPKYKIFLGQIDAAGVGITLTAASHVVFAEEDWVPAKITQCEDRAHRHGQKDTVFVHHLVMEKSVDEQIAKTVVQKQIVLDKALDGKDQGAFFEGLDRQKELQFK